MKKIISKTRSMLSDNKSTPNNFSSLPSQHPPPQQQPASPTQVSSSPEEATIQPPTRLDVIRHRYHNGANLGSIFVLEKWLHPSMFPSSTNGSSELDAVRASIASSGLQATKAKWESHWRNALSNEDLDFLVSQARCTSIRLPIGYFTLGRAFAQGTPFEDAIAVYENAWMAVKQLVQRVRGAGMGVLLDFHAVPGGANGDAHSGSGSGKAELWGQKKNLDLAVRCLRFIAEEVVRDEALSNGVIGIQVVNEAVFNAKKMYEFYEHAIAAVGSVDESIPIYVSDGWDLGRALGWSTGRKDRRPRNPVVVDVHKYYTFSDEHRSLAPQEIIARIPSELSELDGKEGSLFDRGEAQVVVGEWSCVLDGQTWSRVAPGEKESLVRQFGTAQSQKWQQRAGGSFFWTYKMDWMDGGEWGFAEQVKKGNIIPPPCLALSAHEIQQRAQNAQQQRHDLASAARQMHEEYWSRTTPGKRFEHQLYSEGWEVGFSDALVFFTMRTNGVLGDKMSKEGGDKIGCLNIWVKKRLLESGRTGEFVWEWEQGFRAGVAAFYNTVGI
ncbi:glycoside hydrolase superfamily [Xylogone sp. PMI_703]|nr:glycoside hydrolase superfamily [Xylogone sp. PMI_703]